MGVARIRRGPRLNQRHLTNRGRVIAQEDIC
jgi:hypothetical protein